VEARRGGVGLEGELGVVVGVDVDDPRRHDQPGGVDHPLGLAVPGEPGPGDAPVLDEDVRPPPGQPGPIDEGPPDDGEVVHHRSGVSW
jgi:hypothetical protein